MTYDEIAKIFEEIELSLVSSLRRNLERHKAWEREEGFEWSAWQAEKLRNIDRFRRENRSIMNRYKDVIDSNTHLLMEEQFREGEELSQQQFEEFSSNDNVPEPITDRHFFGVNQDKMNKLMDDITTIEQKAETAALRMTDDVYRQTLYKVQLAMGSGSMTLQQAVDSAVKDFLDKGINCIVYKDGKRVNIADYVRMALRTTSTRAKLQGQAKQLSELGHDTVIISSYGKCSDTCLPWQGKVYIDDVFTPWQGEINGDSGKSNYCGKWFPLLSTAVKGGLFHPNCRHTMLQYIDGITKPPEVLDEEKVKELYRKEQQLRALERNVRKAKRKVNGFSDKENIKKAKEELRKAQSAVKEFIEQTNQAENKTIFKRDYGREKVYEGEIDEKKSENRIDYMSNSFRPTFTQSKPISFQRGNETESIEVKKVSNSNFNMVTDVENTRRNKAVRLTERNLTAIQGDLPKGFDLPQIAVVDFDKHNINSNAIGGYDRNTGILYINSKYDTTEKILGFVNQTQGMFANNTQYAPVLHELGHKYYYDSINKLAISKGIEYNKAKDIVDSELIECIRKSNVENNPFFIMKNLSGYAHKGYSGNLITEVVAEGFSVMHQNEFAKSLIDVLNEVVL